MSLNAYLSALTDIGATNKELIIILHFICGDSETQIPPGHNAVLKLGTGCGLLFSLSTLGMVCIPPTGGLSLLIPALAASTATGLLTAAVAIGGAASSESKELEKKVKSLQKKHAKSVGKLNAEIEKLRKVIEYLKKKGHSAEMATVSTLACMAQDLFTVESTRFKHVSAAAIAIDVAIKAGHVTQYLANAGIACTSEVGGGYALKFSAIEQQGEENNEIEVLLETLKKQPEILGMKGIKATSDEEEDEEPGIIFSTSDADTMVKSWNKPEVLQETVTGIIEKLEQDWLERQNAKLLLLSLASTCDITQVEPPQQENKDNKQGKTEELTQVVVDEVAATGDLDKISEEASSSEEEEAEGEGEAESKPEAKSTPKKEEKKSSQKAAKAAKEA